MAKKLIQYKDPQDGEIYTKTATELEVHYISQVLGCIAFVDHYGSPCTLQDSSLANEPAIWLGVEKEDDVDEDRMHLTQEMVKQLLPFLTEFAETGDYIKTQARYKELEAKGKA